MKRKMLLENTNPINPKLPKKKKPSVTFDSSLPDKEPCKRKIVTLGPRSSLSPVRYIGGVQLSVRQTDDDTPDPRDQEHLDQVSKEITPILSRTLQCERYFGRLYNLVKEYYLWKFTTYGLSDHGYGKPYTPEELATAASEFAELVLVMALMKTANTQPRDNVFIDDVLSRTPLDHFNHDLPMLAAFIIRALGPFDYDETTTLFPDLHNSHFLVEIRTGVYLSTDKLIQRFGLSKQLELDLYAFWTRTNTHVHHTKVTDHYGSPHWLTHTTWLGRDILTRFPGRIYNRSSVCIQDAVLGYFLSSRNSSTSDEVSYAFKDFEPERTYTLFDTVLEDDEIPELFMLKKIGLIPTFEQANDLQQDTNNPAVLETATSTANAASQYEDASDEDNETVKMANH